MHNRFLLSTSYIYKYSVANDNVRQSYLDLSKHADKNDVQELLKDSILALDENIDLNLANELRYLISSCFSRYPTDFLPIFNIFINESRLNTNRILTMASILAVLTHIEPCLPIPECDSFVNDALKEIFPQIKSNISKPIFIFGCEIPNVFKYDFVIDLLLSSKLINVPLSDFMTFIYSQSHYSQNHKFVLLIKHIIQNGFTREIDQTILIDLYEYFSFDDFASFLPFLSDEHFLTLFPRFEALFNESTVLPSSFIFNLLNKCDNLNLKLNKIERVFNFLSPSEMTTQIIGQLKKYNFVIPKEFVGIFQDDEHEGKIFSINSDFFVYQNDDKSNIKFNDSDIQILKNYRKETILKDLIFKNYPPNCRKVNFLLKFVDWLKKEHSESFLDEKTDLYLIQGIQKRKSIPPLHLLRLINCKTVFETLIKESNNNDHIKQYPVLLLYMFAFTYNTEYQIEASYLTTLTESNEKYAKFIETNDFDLLCEFDEETLYFVVYVILLIESRTIRFFLKPNNFIKNILSFWAIWFNNIEFNEDKTLSFAEGDWKTYLEEGCKNLANNESHIDNLAINVILSKINANKKILQSSFPFIFANIIIDILYRNEYKADKALFLQFVLNLSNNQNGKIQLQNGVKIIRIMINNIDILNEFNELKLNLIIFNMNEVVNYFLHVFQGESSIQEIMNTILFIQKFIVKKPVLHFYKSGRLELAARNAILLLNLDSISIIFKFMKENGLEEIFHKILNNIITEDNRNMFLSFIPIEERSSDDFINIFLVNFDLEITDDTLFLDVFRRMMNEEKTAIEYLKILFDGISNYENPKPTTILALYLNEYIKYGDVFIKALHSCLDYNPNANVFIRKIENNNNESHSNSEFANQLLSKILQIATENPDKYQPFLFLKNIACTFPFFFDRNPEKIFKVVLGPFDNYSLILDDGFEDEEKEKLRINKIKASIAALSFLISALCSNRVIDSFFVWVFKKISSFSKSQKYCFLIILSSVIKSDRNIAILTIIRNNISIIESLMKQFSSNTKIDLACHQLIYNILIDLSSLAKSIDILYAITMDELGTFNCPYCHLNNYKSTMFPIVINQITVNYNNEILTKFCEDIEKVRTFWYKYYLKVKKENVSNDQVEQFMEHYRSYTGIPITLSKTELTNKIKYHHITEKMVRYLLRKGMWLIQYFFNDEEFPLLPEHAKYLNKVISKANTYTLSTNINRLNKQKIMAGFDNKSLYQIIYQITFQSDLLSTKDITKLFDNLSISDAFVKGAIKYTAKLLDKILENNEDSLELVYLICNVCLNAITCLRSSRVFQKYFYKYNFIYKLIQMILRPQYRTNKYFNVSVVKFLIECKHSLPNNASHIINFLLLSEDKLLIPYGIQLCSYFDTKQLPYLTTIRDYYIHEINSENFSPEIIASFCKYCPSMVNLLKESSLNFLKNLFLKHSEKIEEKDCQDLIFYMLEAIVPPRDACKSFSMSKPIELKSGNREFQFQPIPEFVYNTYPNFWEFFDKNRVAITEIIEKKADNLSKYKLFNDYPELFDFKLRHQYFRQRIKRKIVKNKKIFLQIDRDNIIESSYNEMKKKKLFKKDSKWLHTFIVKYKEEEGIDYGGLTKDFLFNASKAFFENKSGFFVEKEKTRCYQPNCCSTNYAYFQFAGQLIARAIIEGVCIECHLSQPFIKQILHRKLSFTDLENIDPIKFRSLKEILDKSIDENDPLNEYYFEVTKEGSSNFEVVELKENGSQIKVTNENKTKYVELISKYYLRESIKEQIHAFSKGFNSVISHDELRFFSPSEFDLILCGVPFIDVNDMRENTELVDGYNENTPVVILFFSSIAKWEQENLAKLLLFFTGSSSVPVGGFKNEGIKIAPGGDRKFLPRAHTCFNLLELPEYETEEELNQKFMLAINQTEFGIS